MSDRPNPLDTKAAQPLDASAFNTAKDAWKADRDRIVAEVLPKVDAAITRVNDFSEVLLSVVGLIEQLIPLVQAASAARPATAAKQVGPLKAIASNLKAKLACPNAK